MPLIIDGYNLLNVTGIVGGGTGPGAFQRTREALLSFLASSLPERVRNQTVVVFDAADAPPGLARSFVYQGITVRFASEYPDADTLIEKLVQQHSAPRSLVVVSSDHRVQRAARRRKSRTIDSDQWYRHLRQQRHNRRRGSGARQFDKPQLPMSPREVDYWVSKFTDDSDELNSSEPKSPRKLPQAEDNSIDNPFPHGYAEDVLDDDRNRDPKS